MKNKNAVELLEKYNSDDCTQAERNLIEYWGHHLNEDGSHGLTESDLKEAEVNMWLKINGANEAGTRSVNWRLYVAALLLFAALTVFFKLYILNKDTNAVATEKRLANTVRVGGNKAILTLADGKKILLDDLSSSQFTDEGVRISKTAAGQLIYTVTSSKISPDNQFAYNTISTPRGGQYQINLPDGSKVWLNSASTLRFPLSFQRKTRMVELTGEGYFEVKHLSPVDGSKVKFMVKTTGKSAQMVEVLGTHFNVSAYNNEDVIKTTLLEGSVRVSPIIHDKLSPDNTVLKPGEQSVLTQSHMAVLKVDTEDAVAWKNGYFRFNDESLESIMRKVERWYDVDVQYQNDALKKIKFAGVTTRFANVAELLKMLELTGEVKFRIDKNSIVVLGKN